VLYLIMAQGRFWLFTDFNVETEYDISETNIDLADAFWKSRSAIWSKGQLEMCPDTQRLHWQFMVAFDKKIRLGGVKVLLGDTVHAELSRSNAANDYVWKDESSKGRRWEWGSLPLKRNSRTDWQKVWDDAVRGDLSGISAQIKVCHYSSLRKISMDHMKAEGIEKKVNVYVGETGLGKSRRAWAEAGLDAYPKTPTTKFWDGYQGQSNVVIDEFTGQIEITHMLRWLDRYPVLVETKGSGTVLKAREIWITSNLLPSEWYQAAPQVQMDALMRRLNVTIFTDPWIPTETALTESQQSQCMELLVDQTQEECSSIC